MGHEQEDRRIERKELVQFGKMRATRKQFRDYSLTMMLSMQIPKQLPYFCVQFGSISDGYAHVIEDEENFPSLFGHEVIAGVLDIEPRRYKKPRFANHDKHFELALQLKSQWSKVNPIKS